MLFNFLYAVLYSLIFLSITGIPATAQAVSCNDQIPNTAYRYSDVLVFFTEHNGKTYAIAKSAVTGSTSLPDGYFDFSADITPEYQMGGADIASLKTMLSLGKYGAANPVSIDSKDTEAFILKRFGRYLGSATSAQSTFIDAWKGFGAAVGFTSIGGAALPYKNFSLANGGEYTGQDPQAVTLGSDGVWLNGQDGVKTSQIVEFQGKLDCSLSPVDPIIVPPPILPPDPPPDPNTLSGRVCGQDLNGNGYVGETGEIANCIQTTQGEYCPVGSTNCVETYSSPVCPDGSALNTVRDMCQAAAQTACGNGYTWDSGIDKCIKAVTCPENGTFNTVTDLCEKLVQNDCPVGYSYDANQASPTYDLCVKSVECNDGGTFITGRDRCEKAWMPSCDTANGYSYNSQTGVCQRAPICSAGTYNTSYNLCMKSFSAVCPSGYNYNSTSASCEMAPLCPTGTSFSNIRNRCEVATTIITGYAQPIVGTTEIIKYKGRGDTSTGIAQYTTSPPSLDAFSFDFVLQNGQVVLKQECSWGGSGNCGCDRPHWNGWCRAGTDLTQTISGNTLTVIATIFDWNYDYYSPYCDPGFVLSYDSESGSSFCSGCPTQAYDPESGSNYTYYSCSGEARYPASKSYTTGAAASADLSEFATCPAGYIPTSAPNSSQCTTIVTQWGNQTGIIDCTQAGLYSCSAQVNACYTGYTLDGNVCYQNPTCPSGSFDYGTHVCYAQVDKQCNEGFLLDTGTNLCIKTPTCPLGILNSTTDLCEALVTKDCGAYLMDATANLCYSTPICANGAYDSNLNVCLATLTRNCGSYSWSQADSKCLQSASCPSDPAFSLAATIIFSASLDKCVSDTQHNCPVGTTYMPQPIGKCEAVPICSGDGIYNPEKDSCFDGLNTCPLGTQYACLNYNGVNRCSPNACADAGGGATIDTMDESMLKDDARDPNGNCLGQLYIFNGKASRCRPPGLTVGLINNCCQSDEVMTEDTGSTISNVASGIQTAYELGQVAYYGNALATGAAQMSAVTTSASGAVTSMTVVSTATGSTATISGAAAEGAYAAMASGTTGASAVTAGVEAYAAALFNPATIIIAVVVMVVMKVLMGKGCDQADIQTGMQEKAKQCHYVGDYCYKKYFFGCVQKAKGYCCFNSKMARIIQEQGRPQLTTFQPNGDWGAGSSPNCRGFTPDEFQALDFSKIDLSEYFADIQKDLTSKIQNSQQKITDNINKKYQAVQP